MMAVNCPWNYPKFDLASAPVPSCAVEVRGGIMQGGRVL
jgi:hypothetical protein